jgi:hypothetical protein
MASYTNHASGARGINLKAGGTRWIEPGETVELDADEIAGDIPDLGKAPDDGKLDAANADLTGQVDALKAENADLQGKLDAANAALKPYLIKDAVAGLDPKNDAHWTQGGDPKVEAVAAVVGQDVTRGDITAIAPDAKRPA